MADDVETPTRDYRETVFLPETPFPMRAGLPQKEPEILARWDGMDLYHTIRADRLRMHAGSTVPTLQCVGAIRLAAWEAQREAALGGPKLLEQEPNRQSRGRGAAKLYFSDDIQAAIAHADENSHDEGHYASALLHLAAWYHDYLEGQG